MDDHFRLRKNDFNIIIFSFLIALFASPKSSASWSWNLGYHNPPGSTIGLNFQYFWTHTAFEMGVGNVNSKDGSASLYGDLNLKFLFGSGWLMPFLGIGTYAGLAASSGNTTNSTNSGSGAGASLGGGFVNGGLYFKGNPFYLILGVNASGGNVDPMASLGFEF